MPTYNHENIKVNVSILNPDWVELTGETVMTLESNFIAELVENCCTFREFFLTFDAYDLWDNLEKDEEKVAEWYKNMNEKVEIRNADAIIAVYEYALNNDQENYNFEVETENISWVIHDILHATYDAAGCTIYVVSEIEKERIIKSLEITQEEFPSFMPDPYFLEKLEDEFYSRFGEYIDLHDFKYQEEY